MADFAPRTVRVLDLLALLVGVIMALTALSALLLAEQPGRALSVGACLTVYVLLWVLRRRQPQSGWVSWALLALGVVTVFFADGVPAIPLLLFGLLLLVMDHGALAGVAALLGANVLLAVASILGFGTDVATAVLDAVATALLMLIGLLFGMLLREADLQNRAKSQALQQRDELNLALVEANQRLRDSIEMEKELLLADERARAARELHDGLGHRLAVVRMSLEFVEQVHTSRPDEAAAELVNAREGVEAAIDEMRIWVRALNPVRDGGDSRTGLLAVVESFENTGMQVGLDTTGEQFPLTDAATLYCYRFVQEGLTNVLRHARSAAVRIRVEYRHPGLVLTMTNEAGAQNPASPHPAPQPREGFGLRSLRERATALGGTFHAGVEDGRFVIRTVLRDAAVSAAPAAQPAADQIPVTIDLTREEVVPTR